MTAPIGEWLAQQPTDEEKAQMQARFYHSITDLIDPPKGRASRLRQQQMLHDGEIRARNERHTLRRQNTRLKRWSAIGWVTAAILWIV